MNSSLASIKIKQRLSKIDSQDTRNIKDFYLEEVINKAVLAWLRRNKHGSNASREADEETIQRVDDLQFLLKQGKLSVGNNGPYAETVRLPEDYLYFKRVTPMCTKGVCAYVPLRSHLAEEANVDDLLMNYDTQPSFDFEETFHTLIGNKIRVYHNEDFTVVDVALIYYRQPLYIHFVDKTKASETWEWKEDVAELIIDEAVKILAGDIESLNQNALAEKRVEQDN